MKDFLKKLIAKKEQEVKAIRSKIKASESAQEVRELGETLQAVLDELNEARTSLPNWTTRTPTIRTPMIPQSPTMTTTPATKTVSDPTLTRRRLGAWVRMV